MESFSFGLIVAYVLPGFIGLAGLIPLMPVVGEWLAPVSHGDAGLGPPIYALLSATTVGMIVSCFRWLIIDHILEWTGVPKAAHAWEALPEKLEAASHLLKIHYNHYQFQANTVVVTVWVYLLNRFMQTLPLLGPGTDLAVFILCAVLLTGSRDCVSKYRRKLGRVLGPIAEKA
jgi:hypothetical protein